MSALRAIRGAGGGAGCAAADADAEEEEEAPKLEGSLRFASGFSSSLLSSSLTTFGLALGGGRLRPELQIDTMSSPNLDILDGPKPLIRLSSAVERGHVVTWLG